MDIIQITLAWAKKHKEIIAVIFGGSRAKGTAVKTSDYDFGIQLEQDPTPALVERLTQDYPLEQSGPTRVFPEIARHFILTGKSFKTPDRIPVTLGFVNIGLLISALKKNLHYPLIDEQFEFLKTAKVVHDPKGYVADLQTKEFPAWATKQLVEDSMSLASWNVDKYKKALGKRSSFTAIALKNDTLWYCAKAIAAINKIPLIYKYGYDDFKTAAIAQGKKFLAPRNFFEDLEKCAVGQSPELLEKFVNKINTLIKKIGK